MKTFGNQSGILTVDLLFGLTLVMGIMVIVFSLAFALSVIESIQYIAFASSRTYFAGHLNRDYQQRLAERKASQLIGTPGLKQLLNKNWFELNPVVGDFRSSYTGTSQFIGTQIQFTAKMLDFKIPFFGSTTGGGSDGFKSKVNSFLGREPTTDECLQFFQGRWNGILNMVPKSASGQPYNVAGGNGSDNLPFDDNGC